MVETMQRKMKRNACQLSQEIKFVSNQVGTLGKFIAKRFNDISPFINELRIRQVYSNVPEWPQCNWLASFQGDFLDLEVPPPTSIIPRPPRFVTDSPWQNDWLIMFIDLTSLHVLKTTPKLWNLMNELSLSRLFYGLFDIDTMDD